MNKSFIKLGALASYCGLAALQGETCQLVKTVLQARISVKIVHRDLRSPTPHFGVTDGSRIQPVDTNREGTGPGIVRAM